MVKIKLLLKLIMLASLGLPASVQALTVTKTYSGPTVEIDGVGNYGTALSAVDFTDADFYTGALIAKVTTSITWTKTDGTCASPNTGNAYHAETSFRLDTPLGNEILARNNTWSGGTDIGDVTTLFEQSASSIPSGTPVSGTFKPNDGNLDNFIGNSPNGSWNLSAGDNANNDPLCVHSYSVTITVDDDTDKDGIPDNVDIDDDNDGILDINESTLDKTDFELHGDATQVSENEVRLTADSNNQFGTSMSIRTVDLSHNFTIDAEIYLGTKNNGADGISFVLHNDPDGSSAIGTGEGSTLGSMANSSTVGIRNGLSIEFDTYQSSSGSDDPADDHTQIRDTDYSFNDTGGRVTNVTTLNNLEDGNWHTVHLEWDATTFELSYAIDGVSMPGITDTDIATNYFAVAAACIMVLLLLQVD